MGDDTLCSLRSIWRERASRWSAVRIGIAAPPPSVRPSDHRRFPARDLGNGTARRVRLDLLCPSLFFFGFFFSAVTSRPLVPLDGDPSRTCVARARLPTWRGVPCWQGGLDAWQEEGHAA
jgi:hypothetical protein